jgi:hypothetical protein
MVVVMTVRVVMIAMRVIVASVVVAHPRCVLVG